MSQLQEASLSAFSALASHDWGNDQTCAMGFTSDLGTKMVLNQAGAAESLLDRSHPDQSKEVALAAAL